MILVTAFKPFGDIITNSSLETLKRIENDKIIKAYLSVELENTKKELYELIDKYNPDKIVMLGQSGLNDLIAIESRAHNYLNFRIKDNSGVQVKDQLIFDDRDEYLYTKIDIDSLLNDISYKSIDAGSFICNYAYYLALNKNINTVFIHLPLYTNQVNNPKYHYMDLSIMVDFISEVLNKI